MKLKLKVRFCIPVEIITSHLPKKKWTTHIQPRCTFVSAATDANILILLSYLPIITRPSFVTLHALWGFSEPSI
jgi:hypothetical protein